MLAFMRERRANLNVRATFELFFRKASEPRAIHVRRTREVLRHPEAQNDVSPTVRQLSRRVAAFL